MKQEKWITKSMGEIKYANSSKNQFIPPISSI